MDDLELLSDFVAEAREHLVDIEIQLLRIEAMGEKIDDNLVNTVFRAVDFIKGAADRLKSMIEPIQTSNTTDNPVNCEKPDAILHGTRRPVAETASKAPTSKAPTSENAPTSRSGSAPEQTPPAPKNRNATKRPKKESPQNAVSDRVSDSLDHIDSAIAAANPAVAEAKSTAK